MKFKIGDLVYYRKNSCFDKEFDWEEECIYIVYDLTENFSYYPLYKREKLVHLGYVYIISAIRPDCGSGHLAGAEYVKENQIKLYEGNDPDVLYFYNDAKKTLMEEREIINN